MRASYSAAGAPPKCPGKRRVSHQFPRANVARMLRATHTQEDRAAARLESPLSVRKIVDTTDDLRTTSIKAPVLRVA